MSDLPDDIEKTVDQPIVDIVGNQLSKAPKRDYTRLKDILQFMLTEFDRLKTERLQAASAVTNSKDHKEQTAVKTRKRLIWPRKKT